jgi:hypothetical protein
MEDRRLLSGPAAGLGLESPAGTLVADLLQSSRVGPVGLGLSNAQAAVAPAAQHVSAPAIQAVESLADSNPGGTAAGLLGQVGGLVDDVIPGIAQVGAAVQDVTSVVGSLAGQGPSVDDDQSDSQTDNSSPPSALTGSSGPAAALIGDSGLAAALIGNSGPAAAWAGGSSPSGAPPASRNDGVPGPLGNISLTANSARDPVPGVAQVSTGAQQGGTSGTGVIQGVVQSGNVNQEASTPTGIEGPPPAPASVQGPPFAPAGNSNQRAEPAGDASQDGVPSSGLAQGGALAAGPNPGSTLIGTIPPGASDENPGPGDARAVPVSRDVTPSGPSRSRGQGVDVDPVGARPASPHDLDRVIDPALGIEGILANTLPIDLTALDRAIEHCLNGLDATDNASSELLGSDGAWPWLTLALVAATAFLVAEKWRQKTQYRPVALAGDEGTTTSWLFESAARG